MREQLGRNVFRVTLDFEKNKDWESWVLLSSDRHHDNPKCDWDLERKHLDQAKERNALIVDNGDLFCAMQGSWDHRKSKESIRAIHQENNYLDSLVRTAHNFYKPYAANFLMVGMGNHETAITKKHETNLTERFITLMNMSGGEIYNGGYGGWVMFRFKYKAAKGKKQASRVVALNYYHGSGGGGGVTAGMSHAYRRAGYHPDADILMQGHSHDSWVRHLTQVKLDKHTGSLRHKIQTMVRLPTYKNEYADGSGGWCIERGLDPKPLGAYWLRFFWDSSECQVLYELIRAQ